MIALQTSKKLLIVTCIVTILTFNLSMSYVKASSAAVEFIEEGMKATYAGVVLSTMAIAQGVNNTEDFVKEHGQKIYDTAKETWPKMSADMQANFRQSMTEMADGTIAVGNWITSSLDAFGEIFTGTGVDDDVISGDYDTKIKPPAGHAYRLKTGDRTMSYAYLSVSLSDRCSAFSCYSFNINNDHFPLSQEHNNKATANLLRDRIKNLSSSSAVASLLSTYTDNNASIVLTDLAGNVVTGNDKIYNQLDNWIRARTNADHPEGKLGVYAPTEAWTNTGIRLGLSEDGQTILTLPDGVPYDPALHGDYSWRQPLTGVIDGVGAVLNPNTWDWVNALDKTIVRPATIPEIADYVGVDEGTAEDIKNNTKPVPPETIPGSGSLKNPTKKIVWTPLMMNASAMTKKFPFSIPWDFANQLKIFNVEPTTPVIKINAPNFVSIDGSTSALNFEISFKMFDPIASGIRWLLVIGFDIALILMLRRIMPE